MELPGAGDVEIALSRRSHERLGHRRTDDAWLARQWSDPATQVLVMSGGRFPVRADGDQVEVDWLAPDEAQQVGGDGQRVLLGLRDDVVHFALLPEDLRAPDDWATLRTVGPRLRRQDLGLLVQAQALDEWYRAHRHCGRCGGRLRRTGGGYVSTCVDCGRQHFPRTDPAVIMLVVRGDRCLLGHSQRFPNTTMYSTLAGFVEPGESLEEAVRREVLEETGVRVGTAHYHSSQPWPFPASIMLGFHAEGVSDEITIDQEELRDARWFTVEEMRNPEAHGFALPRGDSIARRLIEDWLAEAGR